MHQQAVEQEGFEDWMTSQLPEYAQLLVDALPAAAQEHLKLALLQNLRLLSEVSVQ